MGRNAVPISLHLVNNNAGHKTKKEINERLQREQAMKPKKDDIKPPKWLRPESKKVFKRIANELIELDLLTNVDVDQLATYCDAYIEYVECTKIIDEEGLMVEYTNKAAETNKVPHPLLTKKKALFEQMHKIAGEFGLTTRARASLAIPKRIEEVDPNADLFD